MMRALLMTIPLILAAAIPVLDTGTAGFVGLSQQGPLDTPTLVTSYEQYADIFGTSTAGLANPFLAPSVAGFFANGGQRLVVVRVASADPLSFIAGLQTLAEVDEIAVVAIPGATSPAVQAALIAHAEGTHDRLAILDPATTDDIQLVQDQRAALDAADGHATLYFPWIWATPAGESLLLPPSGFVAGVYARTDTPDSPVGSIATATDVSYVVTPSEQDILNPLGINAIRLFTGSDVRVWGARTLSSDPEWRYVAVRRTALCLEESIQEGTAWAVFEPNDEPLWAQLRGDVGDFLFERWADGWFQGSTPDDAYFVLCDRSTMTQADLDAGRTVILAGFAPLQPAEFTVLRIVHERPAVGVAFEIPAAGPVLHDAAPNPFNPQTQIRFDLVQGGSVRLGIHDLAGRIVRRLIVGTHLAPGRHERRWDGRDASGASAPSGVYVVRLEASGAVRIGQISLVR